MRLTDATYQVNGKALRIRRTQDDRPREIEVRLDGGTWAKTYTLPAGNRTMAETFEVAARVWGTNRTGFPKCDSIDLQQLHQTMAAIAYDEA